jgi:hypothetical protein
MKRNYSTGISEDVMFFTGIEIEKTPAYGMQTLFVTGIQDTHDIKIRIAKHRCNHIFFGANHSFSPSTFFEWDAWLEMISTFLKLGYTCSLDIPVTQIHDFNVSGLCKYNNFIPQIRIPIPDTKLWNYNTMIKIDDIGFDSTNPGVWTHSLHELMDRTKFTNWSEYQNDLILE